MLQDATLLSIPCALVTHNLSLSLYLSLYLSLPLSLSLFFLISLPPSLPSFLLAFLIPSLHPSLPPFHQISELPYGVWTAEYKIQLARMCAGGHIKSFTEHHTSNSVLFKIIASKVCSVTFYEYIVSYYAEYRSIGWL